MAGRTPAPPSVVMARCGFKSLHQFQRSFARHEDGGARTAAHETGSAGVRKGGVAGIHQRNDFAAASLAVQDSQKNAPILHGQRLRGAHENTTT